jgi:uncharacterized protein (TIGR02145 family)
MKDIDGKWYRTITIGKQTWMAQNLSVSRYRNGDTIPQVQDYHQWSELTTGAWCYYQYNKKDFDSVRFGKLYNWYAVNDPRGLAPEGWHIPTEKEWETLVDEVGLEPGYRLKTDTVWEFDRGQMKGSGDNRYRFAALPGGARDYNGEFMNAKYTGYWWTATSSGKLRAWYYSMFYNSAGMGRNEMRMKSGFSVRCVKD